MGEPLISSPRYQRIRLKASSKEGEFAKDAGKDEEEPLEEEEADDKGSDG